VGGGYDDNVLAEIGAGFEESSKVMGGYGRVNADLGYTYYTERVNFGASVATDSRYFPELDSSYYGAHSASVGVSGPVGRRTNVSANQTVSYQPFLMLGLFPELTNNVVAVAEPAAQEQSAPFEDYTDYRTAVDLRHKVSRRGEIEVGYSHQFSNFSTDVRDLRIHRASGRYLHEVSRGLGLRLGYGYSAGEYFDFEETRTVEGHIIDVGVDYSRALSVSRRTTLSFVTGSAAFKDEDATRYQINADVRLNREIGRTWNATAAYTRSAAFVHSFSQPFFSDSVGAELSGLVTRRTEFVINASGSLGEVGFQSTGDNGYESYSATSQLTFALTRNLALTASYAYYLYTFESGVDLPIGLARDVERQNVQLALRTWIPLYRSRSSNASR
jgi:hypothetical protein